MYKDHKYYGIMPDFLSLIEAKSNCRFVYYYVPKNRQENLFESGKADLLIATVRTAKRDKSGTFISLFQLRATVISIEDQHAVIQSVQDLLSRNDLRLVVVRAYDYGPAYQSILEEMNRLGRLTIEPDPVSAARTMLNNPRYVTIMAPTLFFGVVQTEALLKPLSGKLRYDKLDELPWTASGIYISNSSLQANDHNYLKAVLEKYAATDAVWKSYLSLYPPEVVKIALRQREAAQ
ncbi:type 2 periplasmic-binding domain-containing protein [Undibacterium flavidum]|uniref:Solute-binding protein family 3/N-terminal domain-containing protein n=1 Tax=Undibacterium flavidum TaxID=2762297 RepID=A0ABR6Y9D1_9BURK|nr:hypothetical protein [Undibacterium flavidum]MBC3873237.1 hypothetical protein [Undibacterium flavidum]